MPSKSYEQRTAILSVILLTLYPLAAFLPPGSLWSVDFLRYSETSWIIYGVGVTGIGFLWLYPRWAAFATYSSVLRVAAPFVIVFVAVLFGSSLHLLGDGYLLLRELESQTWEGLSRTDRAPLTFWLLTRCHMISDALGGTPETTYRAFSLFSGVAYSLLCIPAARSVTDSPTRQNLITTLLLSAGYAQLFMGYVENYAILYPTGLLLIICICRIDRYRSLIPAALTLGLMTSLHFSSASLSVGLLYVAWSSRDRGVLRVLSEAALFPVTSILLLWLIDFDFITYVGQVRDHTLPLFGSLDSHAAYHLLSVAHLLDLANACLLAAPAAVVLLLAWPSSSVATRNPLLYLCAGPILFAVIANPEIGAFRDWDVLSLPSFFLLFLAVEQWSRSAPGPRSVTPVVGAAVLHAALWIGTNADDQAALNRYRTLMETSVLSKHGQVYGWEAVGSLYRERQNHIEAAATYRRALDVDPRHHRLWLLFGNELMTMGELANARDAYTRSLGLKSDSREALSNLGVVHVKLGDFESALRSLDRSLQIAPDFAEAWQNRGVALARLGRTRDAVGSLREAVRLDTGYVNAFLNLSSLYASLGIQDSARYFRDRAQQVRATNTLPSSSEQK